MSKITKNYREFTALIIVGGLILGLSIVSILVWHSSNKTQDYFDNADASNSVSGNIAVNKDIQSRIKNYNNLPTASRSLVVGTLQNMCKNSKNIAADVATVVSAKYIVVNVACKDAKPSSILLSYSDLKWMQVYSGSSVVSCSILATNHIPSSAVATCLDKTAKEVPNSVTI